VPIDPDALAESVARLEGVDPVDAGLDEALEQVRELIAGGHPWFAALAGPEWQLLELRTGHWPMASRPDDLADLLDGQVA